MWVGIFAYFTMKIYIFQRNADEILLKFSSCALTISLEFMMTPDLVAVKCVGGV